MREHQKPSSAFLAPLNVKCGKSWAIKWAGRRTFIQGHSALQRVKSFPKNYQEMWLHLWIIYSNINLCSCISSKFRLFVCDYKPFLEKKNHLGILTQILKLTFIKLMDFAAHVKISCQTRCTMLSTEWNTENCSSISESILTILW